MQAKVCDPVLRIGTGPLTFSPPLSSWEGAHLGLLGPYLQVVETCPRNEKTDRPGDIIFTFRLQTHLKPTCTPKLFKYMR